MAGNKITIDGDRFLEETMKMMASFPKRYVTLKVDTTKTEEPEDDLYLTANINGVVNDLPLDNDIGVHFLPKVEIPRISLHEFWFNPELRWNQVVKAINFALRQMTAHCLPITESDLRNFDLTNIRNKNELGELYLSLMIEISGCYSSLSNGVTLLQLIGAENLEQLWLLTSHGESWRDRPPLL